MRTLPPAAVVHGVEPEGEDFFPGAIAFGFIFGYSAQSYGAGLFFSYFGGEEPGFMLVLGPFGLYSQKLVGWEFRFLRWHIIGGA